MTLHERIYTWTQSQPTFYTKHSINRGNMFENDQLNRLEQKALNIFASAFSIYKIIECYCLYMLHGRAI